MACRFTSSVAGSLTASVALLHLVGKLGDVGARQVVRAMGSRRVWRRWSAHSVPCLLFGELLGAKFN